MEALGIEWSVLLNDLARIVVALVLALPVAWERERSTRIMGLRTFPLVAVASCGYVLMATEVVGTTEEAQARIIQGLMTGMGFIGGGAILKEGATVRGTATAASIWTTGVVGGAAGYGRFEIALIVALVNFLALRVLSPIEERTGKDDQRKADEDEGDEEE